MKIGIFYFSLHPGPDRQPVYDKAGRYVGTVRVGVVENPTLDGALSLAQPHADEAVMNTHPLDTKDWLSKDWL